MNFVVSFGGGVNSAAMLVGMHERGLRPDAIVFSDTRGEKPETYFFMRGPLVAWLKRVGFPPLQWVARTDRLLKDESLEAECHRLGNLPGRVFGMGTCADKWKIDPFRWWVRKCYGKTKITRAIGYDLDEEYRAKNVPERDAKRWTLWFPLIEWKWDRELCVAAVKRARLPVPPKSACFFCPAMKKHEIIALGKKHPELLVRAIAIEKSGAAKNREVKGLGRTFAWSALVQADRDQQKLFPESPIEDCTMCMDGDAEAA